MNYKNILSILTAICFFNSCVKELEEYVTDGAAETVSTFYASYEGTETKTSINSLSNEIFDAGDKILIFNDAGTKYEYTTSDGVAFTGSDISSKKFFGVYPYNTAAAALDGDMLIATVPNEQKAVAGSFDPKANVSVARAELKDGNYYMRFKNVCFLLKFEITAADLSCGKKVESITVKGNNNEYLAGTLRIDPLTGKYEGVVAGTGKKSIKLTPPDGAPVNDDGNKYFAAGTYYIAVLPQTFTEGISVKMEHSIGAFCFKRGTVRQLSLNRNKIFTIFKGDAGEEYDEQDYIPVAMLPPLANQDGNYNIIAGKTPAKFNDATKIIFIANATDAQWDFANTNNQAEILHGSDVRGYKGTGVGTIDPTPANNTTLYIFTKLPYFSISDDNKAYSNDAASKLFNNYTALQQIEGTEYIETMFVKSFSNMFNQCNSLTSLDISTWDTSSAENMKNMFSLRADAALTDLTVGKKFIIPEEAGACSNMFGFTERWDGVVGHTDNRINMHAPISVLSTQLMSNFKNDFSHYIKWVNYFPNGYFKDLTLSDIPYYTDDSHYTDDLTMTFELDGRQEDIDNLTSVRIGLIRFKPVDGSLTYATQIKYGSREYAAYDHVVTAAERSAKKITLPIKPVKHQAFEPDDNFGYITISADGFDSAFSPSYSIMSAPYTIDLYADGSGKTAWISGLDTDYTGQGCPIQGQSARVTIYINNDGINPGIFDHLTINGWECAQDNSPASGTVAGYTAFTTSAAQVISDTKAIKQFTVTATLQDASTVDLTKKAVVKVWGKNLTVGTTPLTTVDQLAAQNENSSSATRKTWKGVILQNKGTNTRYMKWNGSLSNVNNPSDYGTNKVYWFQTDGETYLRSYNNTYLSTANLNLSSTPSTVTITYNGEGWVFTNGAIVNNTNRNTLQSNSNTAVRWNSVRGSNITNAYRWNAYAITLEYIAP